MWFALCMACLVLGGGIGAVWGYKRGASVVARVKTEVSKL